MSMLRFSQIIRLTQHPTWLRKEQPSATVFRMLGLGLDVWTISTSGNQLHQVGFVLCGATWVASPSTSERDKALDLYPTVKTLIM